MNTKKTVKKYKISLLAWNQDNVIPEFNDIIKSIHDGKSITHDQYKIIAAQVYYREFDSDYIVDIYIQGISNAIELLGDHCHYYFLEGDEIERCVIK